MLNGRVGGSNPLKAVTMLQRSAAYDLSSPKQFAPDLLKACGLVQNSVSPLNKGLIAAARM
ncbi:hypothetical protein NXT3_PB00044 (plasmid) [Sinorhizobium fredii]|uniref:Uncharacterized protein n=1 Tax=Rhizobium fredii TaxID=380 RepID=A0A2L0HB43_RHIFR|nr:hypothetical protein NXT3_PB00044 [Sinorhizobium fredii]